MGGTLGKSGSWVVDHNFDNIPLGTMRHGSIASFKGDEIDAGYDEKAVLSFETKAERRARKISHLVAYSTMFVMSIGFSIVLTGVWPYLKEMDENVSKEFLGWVIAANPLGQMLASPLLGLWGNKAGSVRLPFVLTTALFIFGNIFYSLLAVFPPESAKYMMILARFIVGVSSASVTLCRMYLASSTTLKERTVGIAVIAASQTLGFIIGPAIQTVLAATIPKPIDTGVDWIILDMYSAAGWVAAALGFINFIILLPCIFQEFSDTAQNEAALLNKDNDDNNFKLPKPDYLGVIGLLVGFFVCLFIYVLLETLAVPFVTDQWAWPDEEAVSIVGITLGVGGIISLGGFLISGYMAKRFDERKVMILLGLVPLVVALFLFIPWGDDSIKMSEWVSDTENASTTLDLPTTTPAPLPDEIKSWSARDLSGSYLGVSDKNIHVSRIHSPLEILSVFDRRREDHQYNFETFSDVAGDDDGDEEGHWTPGCPPDQEWCLTVPQVPIPQVVVAYFIIALGYPTAVTLAQSTYSKMLGPKPQGVWMGVLTGVGSSSRVTGPIFVSYVYTTLGTYWCFGILTGCMFLVVVELIILYPRLVPMKIEKVATELTNGQISKKS